MKRVVILQPQFIPWRGVFEQIRLAQLFVHLDDVAIPQGRSFVSRVQIKTPTGPQWLTAPILKGALWIKDVRTDESQPWRKHHLRALQLNYARAPYFKEMFELAQEIYGLETDSLCDFNTFAIEKIAAYLGLACTFRRASQDPSPLHRTERLVELSQKLSADSYLTGHGALDYMTADPFEAAGVRLEIIDYRRTPYPQQHEGFDPHLTILDLIANTGPQAAEHLDSPAALWHDFKAQAELTE